MPRRKKGKDVGSAPQSQFDDADSGDAFPYAGPAEETEGRCSHLLVARPPNLRRVVPHKELSTCEDCQAEKEQPDGRSGNAKKKGKNAKTPQTSSHGGAVWVCLTCGHLGCGRSDPGQHASKHAESSRKHSLCISTSDFQCWCYECDIEITEDENAGDKNYYQIDECRKIIQQLLGKDEKKVKEDKKKGKGKDKDQPSTDDKGYFLPSASANAGKGGKGGGKVMPGVKGLPNLGNTCFFNSILQNLTQTAPLRECLLGDSQTVEGPLTLQLRLFIQSMWDESHPNPGSLFNQICNKAKQFRGFRQQDSQELLRYLLDGVQMEERRRLRGEPQLKDEDEAESKKKAKGGQKGKQTAPAPAPASSAPAPMNGSGEDKGKAPAEEAPRERKRVETFVDKIFGGVLCSTVVCETCMGASRTFEPFLDLSLPIPHSEVLPKPGKGKGKGKGSAGPPPPTNMQPRGNKKQRKLMKKRRRQEQGAGGAAGGGDDEWDDEGDEGAADVANAFGALSVQGAAIKGPAPPLTKFGDTKPGARAPAAEGGAGAAETGEEDEQSGAAAAGEGETQGGTGLQEGTEGAAAAPEDNDAEGPAADAADGTEAATEGTTEEGPAETRGEGEDVAGDEGGAEGAADAGADDGEGGEEGPAEEADGCESGDDVLDAHVDAAGAPAALAPEAARIALRPQPPQPDVGAAIKLEHCLQAFASVETLDEDNLYGCRFCTDHRLAALPSEIRERAASHPVKLVKRRARKQFLLATAPPVLTLHLKRFLQTARGLQKNNKQVSFPTRLDLTPYLCDVDPSAPDVPPEMRRAVHEERGRRAEYELFGVSVHMGGMGGGHYVAYTKCFDQWHYFSDKSHNEEKEARVLQQEAYILFYQRVDSASRLDG